MSSRKLFVLAVFLFLPAVVFAQAQREIDSGFEWIELEEAQVKAAETGKKILIFGYSETCGYCFKMRRESFPDSTVLASLEKYFIPVQLEAESEREVVYNGNSVPEYELARYLRLYSYPTHYFIDSKGEVMAAQPGYIEPDIYALMLDFVGTGAINTQDFSSYVEEIDEGGDSQ